MNPVSTTALPHGASLDALEQRVDRLLEAEQSARRAVKALFRHEGQSAQWSTAQALHAAGKDAAEQGLAIRATQLFEAVAGLGKVPSDLLTQFLNAGVWLVRDAAEWLQGHAGDAQFAHGVDVLARQLDALLEGAGFARPQSLPSARSARRLCDSVHEVQALPRAVSMRTSQQAECWPSDLLARRLQDFLVQPEFGPYYLRAAADLSDGLRGWQTMRGVEPDKDARDFGFPQPTPSDRGPRKASGGCGLGACSIS